MASALAAPLPPNTSLQERHPFPNNEIRSDDEYSIEYYDEYAIVEETQDNIDEERIPNEHIYNRSMTSISVETVEDDGGSGDEYIYEEVVVEENKEDAATSAPLPIPDRHTKSSEKNPSPKVSKEAISTPKPPLTKVPSPPVASKVTPTAPIYRPKDSTLSISPSMKRAKAASSVGLSELSKQLRILQAKNEAQNVEVNRLERELKIMSDLQEISVGDLRKALEDACASEAFGELQNRLAKLKYELEAATLAKKKELRQDAAAPHIANLELRVGELEEVDEKQMEEIRDLYDALRREKARSTRFESENETLKAALRDMTRRIESETARGAQAEKDFQKEIQDMRERQSKFLMEKAGRSREGSSNSTGSKKGKSGAENRFGTVSPDMAADYERIVQLLQKKDDDLLKLKAKLHADEIRQATKLKDAEERSRKVEMDMKVEADKLALTVKELEDADGQNGLRLAQYKARFTIQDERISDMGQQLDSLYTAFNLLNKEIESENDKRAAMMSNLKDADAEIARQTKKKEEDEEKAKNSRKSKPSSVSRRSSSHGSNRSSGRHSDYPSPGVGAQRPSIVTVVPFAPATPITDRDLHDMAPNFNGTNARGNHDYYEAPHTHRSSTTYSTITNDRTYSYEDELRTAYATATAYNPTPERTSTTWELLSDQDQQNRSGNHQVEGQLISGPLIVESNSIMRKWKTRPSRIYLRGGGYQWDIGDKRSFPLQFRVSKVEFHPNYPLSFAVYLDPSSSHAPMIRAAAVNEYDYHRWMAALFKATTGEKYVGGSNIPEQLPSQSYHQKPPPPLPPSNTTPSTNRRFSHLLSSPLSNRPAASRRASSGSMPSPLRTEEPMDDDLKRVLELSKYDT